MIDDAQLRPLAEVLAYTSVGPSFTPVRLGCVLSGDVVNVAQGHRGAQLMHADGVNRGVHSVCHFVSLHVLRAVLHFGRDDRAAVRFARTHPVVGLEAREVPTDPTGDFVETMLSVQ